MKQSQKQGRKNIIGAYGEEIAAKYLKRKGFRVIDRNYLKKWGEIDLVARETIGKTDIVHFVEVKTVSYETRVHLERAVAGGAWRPEEQVTSHKLRKLHRAIESWLCDRSYHGDWQIDVLAVRIVLRESEKAAQVTYIPNIF